MKLQTNRKGAKYAEVSLRVIWIGLGVCMMGYLLPWVVNPSLSLRLGAFDLAEWVSLRLPYRPLDLMLLLRLPLVCLAVIVAYRLGEARFTRGWWSAAAMIMLMIVALLPPIEFFTQFREDVNYGQQFTLVIWTVVIGGVGLTRVLPAVAHEIVTGITAVFGIVCVLSGVSQAYTFMTGFALPVQMGCGAGVMVTGLSLISTIAGWRVLTMIQAYRR